MATPHPMPAMHMRMDVQSSAAGHLGSDVDRVQPISWVAYTPTVNSCMQECDARSNTTVSYARSSPRALQPAKTLRAAGTRSAMLGQLKITSCVVLGMPLLLEGPMRPVTLPCCGFVVSFAGAQMLRAFGLCYSCSALMSATSVQHHGFKNSTAVHTEKLAVLPEVFKSDEVTIIGSWQIHSRGDATLAYGSIQVQDRDGHRRVAVKKVPLPGSSGVEDSVVAGVMHVVSTSYTAGVASPYVCQLRGYCWTDSEVWYATRCSCDAGENQRIDSACKWNLCGSKLKHTQQTCACARRSYNVTMLGVATRAYSQV